MERLEVSERWLKEGRRKHLDKGVDWDTKEGATRYTVSGVVKLMRLCGVDRPEVEAALLMQSGGEVAPRGQPAASGEGIDAVGRWGAVARIYPINRRRMDVRLDDGRVVLVTVRDSMKFVVGQRVPVKVGSLGSQWFLACRHPWRRGRLPVPVVDKDAVP